MSHREVAQHYVVEIAARARTVQDRCARLVEDEFFSDAPPVLARTASRLCAYLTKAAVAVYEDIDWSLPTTDLEPDFLILRNTDAIVRRVAEELRYVEAARTERLPWSIVPSFEALVSSFLPDIQIMLRSMWSYNYMIRMVDHGQIYRRYANQFQSYLPSVDVETEVFSEMKRPFHIVSFPSLEQKHILLHCLLGHEVGHLLADGFLTDARVSVFAAKVSAEVTAEADASLVTLPAGIDPATKRFVRDQRIREFLEETVALWLRALEELLSDAAGIFLFGPAALLSTLDLALQNPWDSVPEATSEYYPPWRMRLRQTLGLLDAQGAWFPITSRLFGGDQGRADRVNERVDFIRTITSVTPDRDAINKRALARIAYREVDIALPAGHAYLLNHCELQSRRPSVSTVYACLPDLISRLDSHIPPNAIEKGVGAERIASFAEILIASWLHKVSTKPFSDADMYDSSAVDERNLMNNLTLKAIEFAHVAKEFGLWNPAS